MTLRPAPAALLAHHPNALNIIRATAKIEYCPICQHAMSSHPRCFWCTVLLGPGHAENVPSGWQPGDRRAIECNFCWLVRMRRLSRVAS